MAPPRKFRPRPILDALLAHEVDFVLIGGMAGIMRGSSYPTYDVDIAYGRSRENLERLAAGRRVHESHQASGNFRRLAADVRGHEQRHFRQ